MRERKDVVMFGVMASHLDDGQQALKVAQPLPTSFVERLPSKAQSLDGGPPSR